MSYFKLNCTDFKNFIHNSKIKLENSLYGRSDFEINSGLSGAEFSGKNLSVEEKIINNLEVLSNEDKIIWTKDSPQSYRGVVVENCTFSDYKILLYPGRTGSNGDLPCAYKIIFIKGILTYEKIEYFTSGLNNEEDLMERLLTAINRKLIQQRN